MVVNNCDLIPRTLGKVAEKWVFDFIGAKIMQPMVKSIDAYTVGYFNLKQGYESILRTLKLNEEDMFAFRPIGQLVVCGNKDFSTDESNAEIIAVPTCMPSSPLTLTPNPASSPGSSMRDHLVHVGVYPLEENGLFVALANTPNAAENLLCILCDAPQEKDLQKIFVDHGCQAYIQCAKAANRWLRHAQKEPSPKRRMDWQGSGLHGNITEDIKIVRNSLQHLNLSGNTLSGSIPWESLLVSVSTFMMHSL
jgi:hypothetical protein